MQNWPASAIAWKPHNKQTTSTEQVCVCDGWVMRDETAVIIEHNDVE